jgi:hypothetical protein
VDDIKHSYLLFTNHQTLISNTYFLTPNHKPLVPNICRFNSASWFFTPYHPLDPPYHEAGLNLLRMCECVDVWMCECVDESFVGHGFSRAIL